MKAIGLDVGEKRIGVARTDPLGITAQGIGYIVRRADPARTRAEISALLEREQPDILVVGLPRNMNDTLGPQARRVQDFIDSLALPAGIPVEYFDERLSTAAARRALLEGDVSRRDRKTRIDAVAASIILQTWLDARKERERRPG